MTLQVAIGSDHAGFEVKEQLKAWLKREGHAVEDFGTHSVESVDYPDFAHPVASSVEDGKHNLGILVCGSGNGVAMVANKHDGIRAAVCWTEEMAALSRQHNDANILCMPGRFISSELAIRVADRFLQSSFEGGRHARRVSKISC